MNGWLILILAIIVAHYLLDTTVSLLNQKGLSPELPEPFADLFDQQKYRESQQYTKARTRLSLIESTVTTAATLIFLVAGGFNAVDMFARSFGFGSIATGLIFTGSLLLLSAILGLPFSIYSTFRLEEQFGFNRTTPATFVLDLVKALALTIILGAPLLSFILWFFESSGPSAWVLCWLVVVLFGLVVQFLAPVLIMPLFNKFTPLPDGELKKRIIEYANHQQFKVGGIFTMDGSKRSTKLNAFFTGFGRFRKIVFFDTLLEKLDGEEIIAVLAHEMGHFKKKHILKMIVASIIQTGLIFYLLSLFLLNPGLFSAFGMNSLSIYASLVFFAFIYSPLSTLTGILVNALSRRHEFEADRFAAETTGRPDRLITGLKKLSRENLSNLTPHWLMVVVNHSHPPVLDRISALNKMEI